MLLHIHKFLLRAYHSMQSTLPYRHGSRGGHYSNSGRRQLSCQFRMEKDSLDQCNTAYKSFQRANYIKIKDIFKKTTHKLGARLQKMVTLH